MENKINYEIVRGPCVYEFVYVRVCVCARGYMCTCVCKCLFVYGAKCICSKNIYTSFIFLNFLLTTSQSTIDVNIRKIFTTNVINNVSEHRVVTFSVFSDTQYHTRKNCKKLKS